MQVIVANSNCTDPLHQSSAIEILQQILIQITFSNLKSVKFDVLNYIMKFYNRISLMQSLLRF